MQDELIRLLERLETVPLCQKLKICDLINEGTPSNELIVERRELINEAYKRGLIGETRNPSIRQDYTTVPESMECILTITGFEFLNQIRIKQAIIQFNESSNESYNKIINLTDKLGISVEKLQKSSTQLENLTHSLIALTIFLAGVTILGVLQDLFSPQVKEGLLIFFFIMMVLYLWIVKKSK